MHPLTVNMRLARAVAARDRGGDLSQEDKEQSEYTDMLIDASMNCHSDCCQVLENVDKSITTLGFPVMKNYTEDYIQDVLEWLYPGGQLDPDDTILCSNNASVDMWNAVSQNPNREDPISLLSKDTYSEVDDPRGHIKKCSTNHCLMNFVSLEFPIMSLL
jgi:hypothetical protein